MYVDFSLFNLNNKTVAVALSGGCDSMVLLDLLLKSAKLYNTNVIALNVEHGIRGNDSLLDTEFVKNYCKKQNVPLLTYSVDCLAKSKQLKASIEQTARILRYECFFDAINSGKCDLVATAHHKDDNMESVLFNLFRGSSLSGVSGIKSNYDGRIIRPILSLSKKEIEDYAIANAIPFVTDKTNFDDDYTRNNLRLNVIPKIKEIFPDAENSVYRFSQTASEENEFLNQLASDKVFLSGEQVCISLPTPKVLLSRAIIMALKLSGIKKDWEKVHVDAVLSLANGQNGNKANLLGGITAIKEYDKIVFYIQKTLTFCEIPFSIGNHSLGNVNISIAKVDFDTDLKQGLKADADKIPKSAVIRFKKPCDKFTKFGGGTKSLSDYLTDKKIPLRLRDSIPVIADGSDVLVVFGIAVSDKVKVDKNTKTIIEFN